MTATTKAQPVELSIVHPGQHSHADINLREGAMDGHDERLAEWSPFRRDNHVVPMPVVPERRSIATRTADRANGVRRYAPGAASTAASRVSVTVPISIHLQ